MTARAFDDDPVLAALASAPMGAPLTEEEQAMLDAVELDPRFPVPQAEVAATIARMRLEQGE